MALMGHSQHHAAPVVELTFQLWGSDGRDARDGHVAMPAQAHGHGSFAAFPTC